MVKEDQTLGNEQTVICIYYGGFMKCNKNLKVNFMNQLAFTLL